MAAMLTAEVPGQDQLGYDTMFHMLAPSRAQTPGFVLHTVHPGGEGQSLPT
jgi:hypothetical protein